MRFSITILACCLIVICVVSILLKELFFVRLFSVVAVCIIACIGLHWNSIRLKRKEVLVTWIGLAVLLIIVFTNAPLRIAFSIYESEFEALSDNIINGNRVDYPKQIGPFTVIGGGIRSGSGAPYLVTSGHIHEINGFVRDPEGKYFNLWSITKLSSNWSYLEED